MAAQHFIAPWNPEDPVFWRRQGQQVAQRNLCLSIPALLLAFAVWMLWSVVVVHLPAAGFRYSTNQLFWLAALPSFCGATLRIFYALAVPLVGGRRFTAWATASLLLPALGLGLALQDPETSFAWMVVLALLCGLGGGNFTSSMAHISFFFPQARQGVVLGLNASLGQLGVAVAQWLVPLVITVGLWGSLGGWLGAPQPTAAGPMWLQNAGFVWVPFIIASALAAWFGMDDPGQAPAQAAFAEQAVIFRSPHNWLMCWLVLGTFGSFIGYSAGLPLLMQTQFAGVDAWHFVWLGPLLGGLACPLGTWLAHRHGGARVTFWCFVAMFLAVVAVLQCLPAAGRGGSLAGFLAGFGVLFAAAGLGHGSTLRMVPVIFSTQGQRAAPRLPTAQRRAAAQAQLEAAAVLGFASALGAYGGFVIPKAFGTSITLTGGPQAALQAFSVFYISCIAVTWWFYSRRRAPMPC